MDDEEIITNDSLLADSIVVEPEPNEVYSVVVEQEPLEADSSASKPETADSEIIEQEIVEEEVSVDFFLDYEKGEDSVIVSMPQYCRESFFTGDSAYNYEGGNHRGIAGDPLPYTIKNDTIMTSLLILCFVVMTVALSNSRNFLLRQARKLVMNSGNDERSITETSTEVKFQLCMLAFTCLQVAILQYFYTLEHIGTTFILESQYGLIAIYFAIVLIYFLIKVGLYTVVNNVFFTGRKNIQWLKSMLFTTTLEGTILYPIVLLQSYFSLIATNVVFLVLMAVILMKILTFYECHITFFRQNSGGLQIILYFCALEAVPLSALWLIMVLAGNYLKVNY